MDGSSGTFVELYVKIYCSLSLFKGIHGHPPDSLKVQSFVRTPGGEFYPADFISVYYVEMSPPFHTS
jgi:hypothetical protein